VEQNRSPAERGEGGGEHLGKVPQLCRVNSCGSAFCAH